MVPRKCWIAFVDRIGQTLDLIRSLERGGMLQVGDLSGEGSRFVAGNTPLDKSIQRIHDLCRI
jgi:hypothetical protein